MLVDWIFAREHKDKAFWYRGLIVMARVIIVGLCVIAALANLILVIIRVVVGE